MCLFSRLMHLAGPATRLSKGASVQGHVLRHRLAEGPRQQRSHCTAAIMATISGSGQYIGDVRLEGAGSGALKGLTAVVKDSYDTAGHRSSNGSPVWLETHPPAERNATAVQALLDAGATIVGKNVMDEMAYSLGGDNYHYGTPVNPACPERLPGGSSSGTAAAVAAGEADIGLAGWFARDSAVLRRVGEVLLDPSTRRQTVLKRWLVAKDAFDLADPPTAQAIYAALSSRIEEIKALLGPPQEVQIGAVSGGLLQWMDAFRIHQGFEIWRQHGAWVRQHKPDFGPGIKERFEMASKLTEEEYRESQRVRAAVTEHLLQLLGGDAVLAIPTAPGPAPRKDSPPEEIGAMRQRLLQLTCIAGLGGLPQVNLPIARVDGCPVGLGLIGPPGSDEALLELTEKFMALVSEQKP